MKGYANREAGRMKIYFCEKCGISIPLQEVVGGRATARDGKTYCQGCSPESAGAGEDLKLYFCDNCKVSIPLQDVITNRARESGEKILCVDCGRLSESQRESRRERIQQELTEKEESRYRLHFCDKCNTSIPQSHLVTGRAVVRGGRTFCERCRGRAEKKKSGSSTMVFAVLLLVVVFVGGYLALGAGKGLFDQGTTEAENQQREAALRAEIEKSVNRTVAEQRAAIDLRLEALTESLGNISESSENFQKGLDALTEKAASTGSSMEALRQSMTERLNRYDEDLRKALDKLAVLAVKVQELKERPVAAAPPARGPAPTPERQPEPEPEQPAAPTPEQAPPQVKGWIDQLADKDAGVRFSAAVELGKAGFKGAAGPLAKVLEDDKDMFVRRAAARSLGELDAWVAVPTLIDTLQDKDIFVAIMASKALETITGQNFGFKEGLGKSELRKVVGKANKWWEEHKNDRTD
jgi:hypothetical protein